MGQTGGVMTKRLGFKMYKMSFVKELEKAFQENGNAGNAVAMEDYMKNHFSF